ncbi:MAG TPA: hypothetical protein VHT94_07365 [Streptosporangiaceae bacterium]|nr:hypothetical protein [Streptosporangiaceae bacterium]
MELSRCRGSWNEPDSDLLGELTHQAVFAADAEAMRAGPPSRIRNPDGSRQGETGHERTTRVVRAALRMLLANGIITVTPPGQRPEWVALSAPEDT